MNISNPNTNLAPRPWHVSLALLDPCWTSLSATSTQGAQGCLGQHLLAWPLCLWCALCFLSGVSCGWVVSGGVGCCAWLSGAVGACRVLSGLSGLSGCRVCRGLSGLSVNLASVHASSQTYFLSELSGCRAVGGCRRCWVVLGGVRRRGGVGLVLDDSVGCQATPQEVVGGLAEVASR